MSLYFGQFTPWASEYKIFLWYFGVDTYRTLMKFNIKRHRTLKILSKNRVLDDIGESNNKTLLGVSFDEIQSKLGYDRKKCELVFSALYENEEVEYTDMGIKGLFLTRKGLVSFSDKKYIKENNKIIIGWLRNFVQIVIPVLALVIAVLSLTLRMDILKMQSDKEMQKLTTTIKEQKLRIETLESKSKKHPSHKKCDSLSKSK